MNTKTLQGLISIANQYQYGQFNLLENEFDINYDKNGECFEFPNYHKYDYNKKYGTCVELIIKTYNDIKTHFPNINVLKIHGQDDKYFSTESSRHYFNIILENNIESIDKIQDKYNHLEHEKKHNLITEEQFKYNLKEILTNNNAIIFDPTYKIIKPCKNSKYTIKEIFFENEKLEMNTKIELHKFNCRPLFMEDCYEYLVGIHNHPDYTYNLGIVFEDVNGQATGYDISSKELIQMRNPMLQKFVEVILSKEAIRNLIKEKRHKIISLQ